jgi:acetaldehyde dehydrogenase (acetylating)
MGSKMNALNTAIIGTGNIGTDLLIKVQRSPLLNCALFAGRRMDSFGIQKALAMGVPVCDSGIDSLVDVHDAYEIVFDATSAADHVKHWQILQTLKKKVIDLTPSRIGQSVVPAVNMNDANQYSNINLISCGGQAAIPIAHAISEVHANVRYIEVVNTIASKSAGIATRMNIDEYVETTEEGLREFTKCENVKSILILNPAEPCIYMQVTVSVIVDNPDMIAVKEKVKSVLHFIKKYIPGYTLLVPPVHVDGRIMTTARIMGLGDYLKPYAGNLDIITCAAVSIAEKMALQSLQGNLES